MNFMNKLERRFGKYAVSNLIIYVLAAYGIGYVIQLIDPALYSALQMDPAAVCSGQVWRLFTWIFTVPQEFGIFVIFMFLFYYWIGTTLERHWGVFRYNLYMLSGYIFMTVGAMLIYLVTGLILGWDMAVNMSTSTYYINLASFLAFATLFPDEQVYFMMILPIKIKWLAIVDAVYLGYVCVDYIAQLIRYMNIYGEIMTAQQKAEAFSTCFSVVLSIIFSVLNFLIFFFATRNYRRISPKEIHRKRVYRQQTMKPQSVTKHKCAICGRTDKDDESLVFRFCSKCNGNYEYCQEHLFTHEHKK